MVSEHQFERVGCKIVLLSQIWLIKFPHIMIDDDDRHDQGEIFIVVLIDNCEQFLPIVRGQGLLEVPGDMLKHIRILLNRSDELNAFHQKPDVF